MSQRLKIIIGIVLVAFVAAASRASLPMAWASGTNTVTFSMNGGSFTGKFNGYTFTDQYPVLLVDDNNKISVFPDDKYISYEGYKTEKGKWYTDRECLEEFDENTKITDSITLYKKWYYVEDGFCLNPEGTVLYKYDGDETLVQIPDTVTTIAEGALDSIENVSEAKSEENETEEIETEEFETVTLVFDMNGGWYSGVCKGTKYSSVKSVSVEIEKGTVPDSDAYPDDGDDDTFKYLSYYTDDNWYTDENCLEKYDKSQSISEDITLYKKWYATSFGFRMNPQKTVLYQYTGGAESVTIPDTVTTIGSYAFKQTDAVRYIALPDTLASVAEDAFEGFAKVTDTVTLTAESEGAAKIARSLAQKYDCIEYEGEDADDTADSGKVKKESSRVSIADASDSGSIQLGVSD